MIWKTAVPAEDWVYLNCKSVIIQLKTGSTVIIVAVVVVSRCVSTVTAGVLRISVVTDYRGSSQGSSNQNPGQELSFRSKNRRTLFLTETECQQQHQQSNNLRKSKLILWNLLIRNELTRDHFMTIFGNQLGSRANNLKLTIEGSFSYLYEPPRRC
jgi:hypothetical protein